MQRQQDKRSEAVSVNIKKFRQWECNCCVPESSTKSEQLQFNGVTCRMSVRDRRKSFFANKVLCSPLVLNKKKKKTKQKVIQPIAIYSL